MTKKQLATRVVEVLLENNVKKHVPPTRTTFHITDDSGHKSDFIVRKEQSPLKFTIEDVLYILETCFAVIAESLRIGDKVSLPGFGAFYLKRRAARISPHPKTGEPQEIKEHYIVKFDDGKLLRTAATIYSRNADVKVQEADEILSSLEHISDEEVMYDAID